MKKFYIMLLASAMHSCLAMEQQTLKDQPAPKSRPALTEEDRSLSKRVKTEDKSSDALAADMSRSPISEVNLTDIIEALLGNPEEQLSLLNEISASQSLKTLLLAVFERRLHEKKSGALLDRECQRLRVQLERSKQSEFAEGLKTLKRTVEQLRSDCDQDLRIKVYKELGNE